MPFIEMPDRIPGLRMRARGDQPWYRFRNAAADEAELFLYDEIGGWGTLAEDFIAELKAVTAPKLRVRMSSPGGSVFEGVALANALRSHPAEVTVQVDGIAASIASVIAMAGDRVVVQPQAMIMVHDAAGVCLGNAQDMADMAALLDKISGNIADAYVGKAGGTRDEWRTRMRAESWFTAEEAVEAGLADEMLSPRKRQQEPDEAEPEMLRKFDFAAYGYRGPERPEQPKPAPPPQHPAPVAEPAAHDVALCTSIGAAIGEQVAAVIRNAVTTPVPDASQPTVTVPEVPDVVDTAAPVHHTETVESAWSKGPNEKRLPSPMPLATAKAMYAWYDNSQVEDGKLPKSAAKLPHHEVSEDGTPGAANMHAVRNALARLPQTKGIPDAEKAAAERHLRAHLADGGGGDTQDQATGQPTAVSALDVDAVAQRLAAALIPAICDGLAPTTPEPPPAAPALDAEPGTGREQQPEPDPWVATVAHLTQPAGADDWAAAIAHLTTDQPSSAATTA